MPTEVIVEGAGVKLAPRTPEAEVAKRIWFETMRCLIPTTYIQIRLVNIKHLIYGGESMVVYTGKPDAVPVLQELTPLIKMWFFG